MLSGLVEEELVSLENHHRLDIDYAPLAPYIDSGVDSRLDRGVAGELGIAPGKREGTVDVVSPKGCKRPRVSQTKIEREADPHRIAFRQKQIDYGKNTRGYDNYIAIKAQRSMRSKEDPWTPDKTRKYSRRAWDGLIRAWRRKLHKYDPSELEDELHPLSDDAHEDGQK